MKLGTLVFFFFFGTLLAWASWLVVLLYIDPTTIATLGYMLFYSCLSLALIGSFFLVGNSFRKTFFRRQLAAQRVSTSLRQALLFSILLITTALLQSFSMTRWWNMTLLIVLLTLLELFFVTRQRQPQRDVAQYQNPRT